ncbi:hypothetical protein EVAR_40464_1 [Eumeta japonica]|uniref:Uncharacterized protein n=1 Tax=Eumeta variegata TaxID=151549 RepID=A0A4C1X0K1_EUMVA|nr:hypothetical protein EVAR_40464_1 [Eumeta japonica]
MQNVLIGSDAFIPRRSVSRDARSVFVYKATTLRPLPRAARSHEALHTAASTFAARTPRTLRRLQPLLKLQNRCDYKRCMRSILSDIATISATLVCMSPLINSTAVDITFVTRRNSSCETTIRSENVVNDCDGVANGEVRRDPPTHLIALGAILLSRLAVLSKTGLFCGPKRLSGAPGRSLAQIGAIRARERRRRRWASRDCVTN